MIPRDPRLADETLLRVAALRAKHRQAHPPQWGDTYTIALPEKAPSAQAWYEAQAHFRAQLPQPRSEKQRP
jgi:hypothetical protein